MPFKGKAEVSLLWVFYCVGVTLSTSDDRGSVDSSLGNIRVRATPRHATITPDDSVSFWCSARGSSNFIDMPYIHFAIMIDKDTVLPLSSGFPGVSIEAEPLSSGSLLRYSAVSSRLTIGPQMYPYLKYGDNVFICQGQNINGEVATQQFIVNKQP